MKTQKTRDPKIQEVLDYFNKTVGCSYSYSKSYTSGISARLKDGFSIGQMKEVIEIKTLEWINNPAMAPHLNPITLFRPSKFPKYIQQVKLIKKNPKKYKAYYEKINNASKASTSASDAAADAISALRAMDGDPLA